MEQVLHEPSNQSNEAMADLPEAAEDRHLTAGRRILTLEAEALLALGRALDQRFIQVIDLLAGITGRVIVTGMGKSGHIGRKIAATLASTGTPTHYVHPGEASHGDLGMITAQDVVLAVSYSGETDEIVTILPLIKRLGILRGLSPDEVGLAEHDPLRDPLREPPHEPSREGDAP